MIKNRRRLCVVLSLTFVGTAAAAYAAGVVVVRQKDLSFGTDHITVKAGDMVEFDNLDSTSHNIIITGDGVNLNSGLQQPNVSFKAPMMKKGVFVATCGIHPKMKMTINVQ
jgi:cytochrome c peroxidase